MTETRTTTTTVEYDDHGRPIKTVVVDQFEKDDASEAPGQ